MSDLEKELTLALKREEPPEGFAERVLARVAEEPPAIPGSRRRPRVLYGLSATAAAAAAAAAILAFGAWRVASPLPESESVNPVRTASIPPEKRSDLVAPAPPALATPSPAPKRGTGKAKRRVATGRQATPRQEAPTLAEARHAQEQLMLALRIASDSLGTARRMVIEESREPGT
jgi:hypothetical protein